MAGGRPSKYSDAIALEICTELAQGISLREWCRSQEDRPHISTVMRWLNENEEFQEQYARARDAQADFLADEILEISDNAVNDWMERQGKDDGAGWVANGEHIQRSRLRVDSRKWLMSKMAPKKYGDKVTQEHTGAGGGPISLQVEFIETQHEDSAS